MFRVSRSKMPPSPLVSCAGRSRPGALAISNRLRCRPPRSGSHQPRTARRTPRPDRRRPEAPRHSTLACCWRAASRSAAHPGTPRAATPEPPPPPPPARPCSRPTRRRRRRGPAALSVCRGRWRAHVNGSAFPFPAAMQARSTHSIAQGQRRVPMGVRATAEPLATKHKAAGSTPAERAPVLPPQHRSKSPG
jgi:hypothetical protein